ncbi:MULTISPECIES: hypothetical protein [unclassified Moorena]|nr:MULTISPECIES: hypothetical protein [unclassified Moorena]
MTNYLIYVFIAVLRIIRYTGFFTTPYSLLPTPYSRATPRA